MPTRTENDPFASHFPDGFTIRDEANALVAWAFRNGPLEDLRRTPKRRSLTQQSMLDIVKRHATTIGLDVSRVGRRGICTHSLRKTALNNALEHGAQVEEVQQWVGHADIRTTQEYISYKEKDAESAARRCQIR